MHGPANEIIAVAVLFFCFSFFLFQTVQQMCVFCRRPGVLGNFFADGPANDCCTVCVLQTVQLITAVLCVLQTARSTGQCFADGPANVVLCVFCRRPGVLGGHGEQGVCELRGHVHALVATGRHGPLPVQRLRSLQQDERHEQTPHQTAAENGQCCQRLFSLCPLPRLP